MVKKRLLISLEYRPLKQKNSYAKKHISFQKWVKDDLFSSYLFKAFNGFYGLSINKTSSNYKKKS